MKPDTIQIKRYANRVEYATEFKDFCPFHTVEGCGLEFISCRYGLTEINVPNNCPLIRSEVTTIVNLVPQRRKL